MRGEINPAIAAAVVSAVAGLKGRPAPTRIGYNDMAVMAAFGITEEYGTPTLTGDMISAFLATHPAVPEGARMDAAAVEHYLGVLHGALLLEATPQIGRMTRADGGASAQGQNVDETGGAKRSYRMRPDVSACIVSAHQELKSLHIDDELFRGFSYYCAGEIVREREARNRGRSPFGVDDS